jgi:hypothetical protein
MMTDEGVTALHKYAGEVNKYCINEYLRFIMQSFLNVVQSRAWLFDSNDASFSLRPDDSELAFHLPD